MPAGRFNKPKGVAVNLNPGASLGDVWVSDTSNNRIQKYSAGTWTLYSTTTNGAFSSPQGLDVDTSGNIWIADFGKYRLMKFDGISTWTQYILGTSSDAAYDVAVDASGNIWIVDASSRLMESTDGGSTWNQRGGSYLLQPTGVAVDPSTGDVWVSDSGHNQVAMYDVSDNTWTSYGASGTGPGQFNFPTGLAVNALGDLWVADTGNNRIQSTVPEPVTMAGLALGLSCLTGYIRRRRTA
jgi:streptogramin lyase